MGEIARDELVDVLRASLEVDKKKHSSNLLTQDPDEEAYESKLGRWSKDALEAAASDPHWFNNWASARCA